LALQIIPFLALLQSSPVNTGLTLLFLLFMHQPGPTFLYCVSIVDLFGSKPHGQNLLSNGTPWPAQRASEPTTVEFQ
jgi:hypothetical protein